MRFPWSMAMFLACASPLLALPTLDSAPLNAIESTCIAPVLSEKPYRCGGTETIIDNVFQEQAHRHPEHPIYRIKNAVYNYFDAQQPGFTKHDEFGPVVSIKAQGSLWDTTHACWLWSPLTSQNCDDYLLPADDIMRSPNYTYFVDEDNVLRSHTSAHLAQLLRQGETKFLVTGDVYRRDPIDAIHYPIFHQMDGTRLYDAAEWQGVGLDSSALVLQDLNATLEGLARHLFGDVEMRWVDAYFSILEHSFELEVFAHGQWMEVLACGTLNQAFLDYVGLPGKQGWSFGLGLDRMAMIKYDVPEIGMFWAATD